ncbi:RNA-directed DNA polymerase, eukaryota, reverse transcriptase zinc-binding domain protein [Tanacetum coccineum]
MIFKVDFEKAYDSVSWKFLDHMLTSLGFGVKWRNWIQECLKSARSSILVNGCPSPAFLIKRGLRQGNPLSPFLFIIIMEGLHLALKDAVLSGLLRGTKVFYLASGFKINIAKSNVYGIRVSLDDIFYMARATGCASGNCHHGRPLCCPLKGGSGDRKKMAWVKWGNVMASLDKGGLGVGSLKAFNLALLHEWRWRLVNNSDVLWAYVIKDIHGTDAGMDGKGCKTKGNVSLSNQHDSWQWSINPDGIFTVNATRNHIDDCLFPSLSPSTRWSKFFPLKEIPTITCPSCNAGVESNDHIFFGCDTATWVEDWRASKESKDRVYVITATTLWMLWRYRNGVTFNSHPMRKCDIFDNIRLDAFMLDPSLKKEDDDEPCQDRNIRILNLYLIIFSSLETTNGLRAGDNFNSVISLSWCIWWSDGETRWRRLL